MMNDDHRDPVEEEYWANHCPICDMSPCAKTKECLEYEEYCNSYECNTHGMTSIESSASMPGMAGGTDYTMVLTCGCRIDSLGGSPI